MRIAITGHRPNKLGNDYDLKSPLVKWIKEEIKSKLLLSFFNSGPYTMITGMALGIDTLFAQIAIEKNIPFIAAIPFKGQELVWPQKSQELYHDILKQAKEIRVVDQELTVNYEQYLTLSYIPYSSSSMQKRNEWMVNNCDKLIAVWNGSGGGTSNCYDYAVKKIGRENIIWINPIDFKLNSQFDSYKDKNIRSLKRDHPYNPNDFKP